MADRNYYRAQAADPELKLLNLKVTVSSAGVVTSQTGSHFSSGSLRTDLGVGIYRFPLQDRYSRVAWADAQFISSGSNQFRASVDEIVADNATSNYVTVVTLTGTTRIAPTVAGDLYITLGLYNSSVVRSMGQ